MILPLLHQTWIDRVMAYAVNDSRIDAVLGAGSMIHGGFDAWSDIDLVVVCAPDTYDEVMAQRQAFADGLGDLLRAFSGEHVGEPRLLICLYGPPLIHIDFKFVVAGDLNRMVEMPIVLWAREETAIRACLAGADVMWPDRPAQWFEDRFWTWLHYGAAKLRRGELFEAMGMLAFLNDQVFGPMLARRAGRSQRGVRRIEQIDGCGALENLHPPHDATAIAQALRSAADLYLGLRADLMPERTVAHMPEAILDFIG